MARVFDLDVLCIRVRTVLCCAVYQHTTHEDRIYPSNEQRLKCVIYIRTKWERKQFVTDATNEKAKLWCI